MKVEKGMAEFELNGVTVHVKDHVPYAKQREMALEYVRAACIVDDTQRMMYESYDAVIEKNFLICKYYTDMDTDSFLFNKEGLMDAVDMLDIPERFYYEDLPDRYARMTIRNYNEMHAVGQEVKVMLGDLLKEGGLSAMLMRSNEASHTMAELMKLIGNKDDAGVAQKSPFEWAAKKN